MCMDFVKKAAHAKIQIYMMGDGEMGMESQCLLGIRGRILTHTPSLRHLAEYSRPLWSRIAVYSSDKRGHSSIIIEQEVRCKCSIAKCLFGKVRRHTGHTSPATHALAVERKWCDWVWCAINAEYYDVWLHIHNNNKDRARWQG